MKLFVYGTLQTGYGNNCLLREATSLGQGLTEKPYVLLNSGIPFAVPFTKDESVFPLLPIMGELFEINKQQLARCDSLEGHPDWYLRKSIKVSIGEDSHDAMIYEMPTWRVANLAPIINESFYRWGWKWRGLQ